MLLLLLASCSDLEPRDFVVAHHRGNGCDGDAPESSLAAFECIARACAAGTGRCALEADVQVVRVARSGSVALELRMLHDATTDRTATCELDFNAEAALDLGALEACRLLDPRGAVTSEPIPTLDQTIAILSGTGTRLFLEPKVPADPALRRPLLERSLAALTRDVRARTVITSFDLEFLALSRRLAPDVPTACFTPLGSGLGQIWSALSDGVLADVDRCLEAGHDYVFVPPNFLEGSVLQHVRAREKRLGVFGPDTADGAAAVERFGHGIDVVYADHPSMF